MAVNVPSVEKPAMGDTTGLLTARFAPNVERPATTHMIGMAANVLTVARPETNATIGAMIVRNALSAV